MTNRRCDDYFGCVVSPSTGWCLNGPMVVLYVMCEFIITMCSFCSYYRVMGHGKTWLTSARNAEMPSGMWNSTYQGLNQHHLIALLGRTKTKLSDCRIKGSSQDPFRAECQVTFDEVNYMLGKIEFVDLRCAEAFSCFEGQYSYCLLPILVRS
jgi:hypothetical protein